MSFIQPPFWASTGGRAVAPHAIAVLVTPAVAIVSSSIAAASVLVTATPHDFVTGDTVAIAGHTGSTPAVDGARVVTVIDDTHVSIPLPVTVAGAGGTITRTIARKPLTLAEGKGWAGLDWADGDARDVLMTGFIAAAAAKVEQDTGYALLRRTIDVYADALPAQGPVTLPVRPLQAVRAITSIDTAGDAHELDAATYVVDLASARIGLALGGVWPTDLRPFQPYVLRIVVGWPSVAQLLERDPLLVHAVGLLTAHYATVGRDLTTVGTIATTPYGYDDAISGYVPVTVA